MSARSDRLMLELGFLGVFVAIIAAAFYETRVTLVAKRAASGDAFSNSALFPEIIAGLMAVCALAIAIQALLQRGARPADSDAAEPASGRLFLLLCFLAIVVFYIATFRLLGYYISTVAATAAMLALLGTRSPMAYVAFPLGVALLIGFVFEILFNVVLPLGWFGLTLQPVFR